MRTLLLLAIFATAISFIVCGGKNNSYQNKSAVSAEEITVSETDSVAEPVLNLADASL